MFGWNGPHFRIRLSFQRVALGPNFEVGKNFEHNCIKYRHMRPNFRWSYTQVEASLYNSISTKICKFRGAFEWFTVSKQKSAFCCSAICGIVCRDVSSKYCLWLVPYIHEQYLPQVMYLKKCNYFHSNPLQVSVSGGDDWPYHPCPFSVHPAQFPR